MYLNYNRLTLIPESVSKCEKLQELDVVRCGVLRLSDAFSDIWSLENVYVDERTVMFYQNPRFLQRQRIVVVRPADLFYRPTQTY